MVWHFLTARSQARQREWERESKKQHWKFWTISKCFRSVVFFWFAVAEAGCSCVWYSRPAMWIEGEFFQRPAEGFSVAAWRSEVLEVLGVQYGMACMAWRLHEAQRTCHMCHMCFVSFFGISSQIWETRIWMHVGLACAFCFRESRRFPKRRHHQPSRVVTGNCTTFFTCTATVLKPPVRYYRPGEKIYGNTRGQLLHCQWKGHNACLPDCVRNGLGVGKVPE